MLLLLVLVVTNANDADDDDGSSSFIRACLVMGSAFGTCFVEERGENEATCKRLLDATDDIMAAEENLMMAAGSIRVLLGVQVRGGEARNCAIGYEVMYRTRTYVPTVLCVSCRKF